MYNMILVKLKCRYPDYCHVYAICYRCIVIQHSNAIVLMLNGFTEIQKK